MASNDTLLIDDDDYWICEKYSWCKCSKGYAIRDKTIKGKRKRIYLHRELLKPEPHEQIDHINGNKLDNRRCNLRICNNAENNRNKGITKNNTSGYKGIGWYKKYKKWRVRIMVNYKEISLGYYSELDDAIDAYNKAAAMYHHTFAKFN